jgi:hypothetical protein
MAAMVNWSKVPMLTPGMKHLGNSFNNRFSGRDGASDGALGDYAHTQERSGHNPDDTSHHNAEWDGDSDSTPEIRAIDVDDDLRDPDVSMQDVIDHMRALPGLASVIRYMIYNRKIYRASNGFRPEDYTGASAHTEHAHFSGAYTQSSDANTTFDFKFDQLGDPVAKLDADDYTKTAEAVWAAKWGGDAATDQAGERLAILLGVKDSLAALTTLVVSQSAATADEIAAALAPLLIAAMPEGTLTQDQVEEAVKDALRSGTATP